MPMLTSAAAKTVTFLLAVFGLIASPMAWATSDVRTIRVNEAKDANGNYAMKMVRLALSKVEHQYEIQTFSESLTQSREFQILEEGGTDLAWAATKQDWEDKLLPIRVCLYKGLLGYRIFLIHEGNQAKFDGINTLDDLRKIALGQGRTWSDSDILEANGLNVVRTTKYESLFYMLDGGRFDAFPRGVQEPWAEISSRPKLALTTEKRLMLSYKNPFYLFTNKKNVELAADLERGLNIAIADGSFDEVFFSDPMVKAVLENAHLDTRLVFDLHNPYLPSKTPVDRPELWLDISSLKTRTQIGHSYESQTP